MTNSTHRSRFLMLAGMFLLLGNLAGCGNNGIEPGKEPPKATAQTPSQDSEMLVAAAKGDNARIKELLDKGVDVNMRGADSNTPIMEAAYAGHLDTVKLLLDHGADLS